MVRSSTVEFQPRGRRARPTHALTKLGYYARSIPRLLVDIKNPLRTSAIFLGVGRPSKEIQLRRSGLRFLVRDALDIWILKETCLDEDYLPGWVGFDPTWRVIDIGGGLGDFAILAATRCFDGVVHVYEPHDDSFRLLRSNLAANKVENVVAFRKAIVARACHASSARNQTTHPLTTRFDTARSGESSVPAISLENALDASPGGECDFLKIDCEGGEFEILLESDLGLLARIHRISLEYHDGVTRHGGPDIARHLEEQGFQVWEKSNPVHRHLGQLYAERLPD